jgi:phosphoribosyl 1,2-cyclic phosphate phosphodiesterase
MRIVFLGSGTSHGVPVIACHCRTCTSTDPRDKRTNASLLIEKGDKRILIDCGRDFHWQALRHDLDRVDHLFLTHTHFDHIAGIDDLRVFNHKRQAPIPVYGKEEHLSYIRRYIYHYLFDDSAQKGGGIAQLEMIPIAAPIEVEGLVFEPLTVLHGALEIYGYRFGRCAYISDVSAIPGQTVERLKDLDVLIIDALRFRPSRTHFTVEQALGVAESVRPAQTYFTHICHDLLHEEVEAGLRDSSSGYSSRLGVSFAYDGLTFELDSEGPSEELS